MTSGVILGRARKHPDPIHAAPHTEQLFGRWAPYGCPIDDEEQ